jgi:hypothetical protein
MHNFSALTDGLDILNQNISGYTESNTSMNMPVLESTNVNTSALIQDYNPYKWSIEQVVDWLGNLVHSLSYIKALRKNGGIKCDVREEGYLALFRSEEEAFEEAAAANARASTGVEEGKFVYAAIADSFAIGLASIDKIEEEEGGFATVIIVVLKRFCGLEPLCGVPVNERACAVPRALLAMLCKRATCIAWSSFIAKDVFQPEV